MELSIVIVNFNTCQLLKDCLASVFNQTRDLDFEVLVVDNASNDNSVEMVKKEFPTVKLITNFKNLGFAKANNLALRQSRGEFILLLNSDTFVLDNAVTKMVKFMKENPDVGIVGPKLLNPDKSPQPSIGQFLNLWASFLWLIGAERLGLTRSSPGKIRETDWVSGACFMVRREVLTRVGLLDENFFMYLEEMELCYRAKNAGFKIYFYPEAQVLHLVRGSGERKQAILEIYKSLNYFYQKHKSKWQQIVLKILLKTKAILAIIIGGLTGDKNTSQTYEKAYRLV